MPDPDNWKTHGDTHKCWACQHYVTKATTKFEEIGRCRRNAPTMAGYPVVFPNDWCGEHKLIRLRQGE